MKASNLSKYFKPYVAVDGEPVLFCPNLEKELKDCAQILLLKLQEE